MKLKPIVTSLLPLLFLPIIVFSQNNAYVYSLNEIKELQVIYRIPDFQHPAIILNRNNGYRNFTFTINLDENLVKFSSLSSYPRSEQYLSELKSKGRYSKIISKQISDLLDLDSVVICLFSERYEDVKIGWFDLLVFSKITNKYYLREIYPISFGSSFYFTPKLEHVNKDTIKVGGIMSDETEFDESYSYLSIKKDSIVYFRQEEIHGLPPSVSNPINGATTKRIFNEYFDNNGSRSVSPIYYDCTDKNGNVVYGQVISDSLSLYELEIHRIGKFLSKVKSEYKKIKVGQKSNIYGSSKYIAIEFEGKWYWVPENQIKL